jgi:tetratricopeptide (TPR) repeat protein
MNVPQLCCPVSIGSARLVLICAIFGALAACSTPDERAQSYLAKAQELLAKNEDVKASLEFRNAIKNKKDLLPAWRGLATIEEKRQNYAALGPILRTVVELDPNDLDARLKLGKLLLLSGAVDQALTLVNVAAEVEKPPASVLALRAAVLYRLRDVDGAVRDAKRALDVEPQYLDALVVLAAEQLSRRDAEAALVTLAQAKVSRDQELIVGLLRLQAFEQMKDLHRTEMEVRHLIEIAPNKQAFRKQLVAFYLTNKRELDAEKELRAAAAAEPNSFEIGMDVIRFVNTVKGRDAARQEFADRIKAGGDVFPYRLALAQFEFGLGNSKEAIGSLEKLIAGNPPPDQKLKAQVLLAGMLLAGKNLAAAEPVITDVLAKDKRNTDGLRLRAMVRIERGQLDTAIADLREALNDSPQSTPLRELIALAYEKNGAIELAEKSYADATRDSGFAPGIGLKYAGFLQRRSSISHLDDLLTELASRNPTNVEVLTALAQVKLQKQEWAAAQQIADAIKLQGDKRGLADQIRGEALSAQNKLNESIEALQNAVSANPATVGPMFALVRAYLRAKKPAEAETFLQGVLKANPANAEALVLLGSTQFAKGAPQEAEASFKAAIQKQPKSAVGYGALSDFYARQKNSDEALKIIQAGLHEQPDNYGLRLGLAGLLEQKGDVDEAIKQYETLLAKQPDSLVVMNNLASLLSDYRSDKESLDRAQALGVVLRKSNVPHFKDTAGWLHYQRGEYRLALPLLEEAATALPNLAQVRYHLAMTYIALGQREKATEHLKKALELEQTDGALKTKIQTAIREGS